MNGRPRRELEKTVRGKVRSGWSGSAGEALSEGLRLPVRDEVLELDKGELSKKIRQGLDSLGRGEGVDGEEFFARMEADERTMAAKAK